MRNMAPCATRRRRRLRYEADARPLSRPMVRALGATGADAGVDSLVCAFVQLLRLCVPELKYVYKMRSVDRQYMCVRRV